MTPHDSFYTPTASHNPMRFHMPVGRESCVGPRGRLFMMGGVGLGSAICALEAATQRPLICATAQYLSFAGPEQVVDIDVHVPVVGKAVTQARAISHVGEKEIIAVSASLGRRDSSLDARYAKCPEVPNPETLETVPRPEGSPEGPDLFARVDRRRVDDPAAESEGRSRMWVRTFAEEPVTAGLLAVFADFLPGAIPRTRGSSSLDNTLRILAIQPTRWCLLDSTIHALVSGFFHGEMRIFAEDGTLMAIASQSGSHPPG